MLKERRSVLEDLRQNLQDEGPPRLGVAPKPINPGGLAVEAMMTRPKSVAIVALGESCSHFVSEMIKLGSTNAEMPYEEVWTVNRGLRTFNHDKLFVMDDLKWLEAKDPGYAAWLREHPNPIITSTGYFDFPMAVEYPLNQVIGFLEDDIFTVNTVSYALAYAIYIGVEKVYLYGCDFFYPDGNKSEQGGQAVAYLLGLAKGKYGLDYGIPSGSSLLYSNKATIGPNGIARLPYYGYHRKG